MATTRPGRFPLAPTCLLAAALLAACDGSPDTEDTPTAGAQVVDPWVRAADRPADSGQPGGPPVNSAAYLTLRNPGPEADAIVGIATDVADTAELHRVTLDDGVMRMRAVDSVSVPARGAVALEPGGYHIMLVGLQRDLAEDDTVALTIRLRSMTLEVRAPVRREPPE